MWTFTLQVTCMTGCHSWLLPCEESSPGWVSWSLFLRVALCFFGAIIFLSSPCEWSLGLPAGLLEQLMTRVCFPSFNLHDKNLSANCTWRGGWQGLQLGAWLTPALGQTSSSPDWGFSWTGAVGWVCHCAAATGWRAQQCLAWPRHSMWSPQRAVL